MSLELIKTSVYFLTGSFLIFLAITISRDNFSNKLNRITGAMLLFAGLGPIFMAMGTIIDFSSLSNTDIENSMIFNLHYIWELFFPLLLLFSLSFPNDRLKQLKQQRYQYLVFIPQLMHLIILLFFAKLMGFMELLRVTNRPESFSTAILKPLGVVVSWLMTIFSFVRTYQDNIFGGINILYAVMAIYFLETGKKYLTNPHLLKQTKIVLWATRIGLGLFLIAQLGAFIFPYSFSHEIKSIIIIIALITGSVILIFATIRYQFLDVRLIFRQSFVYSITSAVLVGAYIFIVVESKRILKPIFGDQTQVVSYAFIILLLLLFQPINNWIDDIIRSMFIRTRTDYRNVLERFSRQVISLFDPIRLRQIIDETLKTTLLVEKIFFVLYDDKVKEYALVVNEDNPKQILINRDDLMLKGINLLNSPTYYHTLDEYGDNSKLADFLTKNRIKLILPLKDAEQLLGFLALTRKVAGYRYSKEDLNLLGVLSNQIVSALTNARLYVDSLEKIRLQEEVTMARQIQLDLLPAQPPRLNCLQISAHSIPSRTVGGDFFDFIQINEKKIGIVIADASGKGMPAALMIAQTQAFLRSEVTNGNPINRVLKNMNQHLVNSSSPEKYVTLFYGELDTSSGLFHYANAGHNYPIWVNANGEIKLLKTGGPIIGALPYLEYQADSIQLSEGDTLFLFTDGLAEAMDNDEKEYTEERIRKFITSHRELDPNSLIDSILQDVRSFDPTYPPRDDTTIIALKVNKGFPNNGQQTQTI